MSAHPVRTTTQSRTSRRCIQARPRLHGLACLLLVSLAASCGAEGDERLFVIEAGDLGTESQRIGVFEGDQPVTDAEVTLNGVALAHAGDGIYEGELVLSPGSELTLEAAIGSATVVGTATVPLAPILFTPQNFDAFTLDETILVTWAAVFPDREEVVATWNVGSLQLSKRFPVSSPTSDLEIPASELPRGIYIALEVLVYNDGALSGPYDPASRLSVRNQNDRGPEVYVASPYLVFGSNLGPKSQRVRVLYESEPVTDAVIAVNDVALSHTGDGFYEGELPEALPVGAALTLDGSLGLATWRANGRVPEAPVLTAPATGTAFNQADLFDVTWTSETTPDRFAVLATWTEGDTVQAIQFDALAEDRSVPLISASEFPPGVEVTLQVLALNDGSFLGSVDPFSLMGIASTSAASAVITVNP